MIAFDLPRQDTISRYTVAVQRPPVVHRYHVRKKVSKWTPEATKAYHRKRRARNMRMGLRADGKPRQRVALTPAQAAQLRQERRERHRALDRARRAAYVAAGLNCDGMPRVRPLVSPYGTTTTRAARREYQKNYRAAIKRRGVLT